MTTSTETEELPMENKTRLLNFIHSGDMGDIVAGLASVKEICEKENAKARVFLDTTGGKEDQLCLRQSQGMGLKFNRKSFDFLRPLIEAQPYVCDCSDYSEVKPLTIDYNLNAFRACFFVEEALKKTHQNLVFSHQLACGLDIGYKGPWLTVPECEARRKVLMARSTRYHSSDTLYLVHRKALQEDGAFVGTDLEAACVKDCLRMDLPRAEVKDALDVAKEIRSSEKFLCNGTLAYWIAVGMGHQSICHELGVDIPTTFFPDQNPKIEYVMGNHIMK